MTDTQNNTKEIKAKIKELQTQLDSYSPLPSTNLSHDYELSEVTDQNSELFTSTRHRNSRIALREKIKKYEDELAELNDSKCCCRIS